MNSIAPRRKYISVISANYNGGKHLADCIDSVQRQTGIDVEHIVIDGGSTDGSAAILEQSSDTLAYWCSEPDKGIADAMNKGILKAEGEWLLFLHSDDMLLDHNSLSTAQSILESTNARIVGFPLQYGSIENRRILIPRGANFWLLLKTGFLHQATFIHHTVFDGIGAYDTSLSIAMDYDFFLRAWKRKIPTEKHSMPVLSWMRDTGISSRSDWETLSRRLYEERSVQMKFSKGLIFRLFYKTYWLVYLPYRRILALL